MLLGFLPFGLLPAYSAPSNESTRAQFTQGQEALVNHRDAEALDIFRALLDGGSRSAPVYSNLGVAYQRLRMQKEAISCFQEAKKLNPSLPGIDLNLGLAFFKHRDFEEAVEQFATVLAAQPQNTQARYLSGLAHYMLNQYRAAVDELLPLKNSQSTNLEYFFVLGVSLGQLNRMEDSRQAFSRMIELGGSTSQLHVLLAQAYLALNDDRKALEQANQAISLDPRVPFAHYYRGLIYERTGRQTAAIEDLELETKISPREPWAYERAGKLLIDENKIPQAISILCDGVTHNPDISKLLVALAKAYRRASRPAEALPLMRRALVIEPENGSFHYQLGRVYYLLDQPAKGRQEMQLAARLTIKYNQRTRIGKLDIDESFKQPLYLSTPRQ